MHAYIHTYTYIYTYTYMHAYIYTHICMHRYMHTYTRTCIHTCIHTHTYIKYIHTYVRKYVHTFMHTYMHTYIHIYIHTYVHNTYIHIYIQTYIHTYIHACIHTYIRTYIHTYIHTSLNNNTINPRKVIIYTDCRVSLDSLSNPKNHTFLVEKFRKEVANLGNNEWKIKFSWVKAYAGNYGNETADRLAKEASRSHRTNYKYNRIPISAITYDAAEEAERKWQTEWTTSLKAAATK